MASRQPARRQVRQAQAHPAARQALDATVRAGAIRYERARHLPRLIRAGPDEYAGDDAETARAIVARLVHALNAERRRGRSGHWTYDMNRHIALMQALAAERASLARLTETPPRPAQGNEATRLADLPAAAGKIGRGNT